MTSPSCGSSLSATSNKHFLFKPLSGVIGGSFHTQRGGGSNPLCLPLNPSYTTNNHDINPWFANLYGAENQTDAESRFQQDPVCAVCQAPYGVTLMKPATTTCQTGWALQYAGYIMAEQSNSTHERTTFICVDDKQEARENSNRNDNGYLLYYTKGRCGSLPCPPFVDGGTLACVVCSR